MRKINKGSMIQHTTDSTVDIEPDMISDGRVYYPVDSQASEAIVIHCGDARFQTAFRRFITEELHIKQYTPIIIGGGAHAFGMKVFLPKNFKILWEQVKFYIKSEKIKNIIIINHEDCGWYEKMSGYHVNLPIIAKGKTDLKDATLTLLKDFGDINIRTYWAGIEHGRVYFDEVK
ncbi:MAG: hypothetical protein ABIJ45_01010 [Candidatus Zixiibacteriota bacterium]